MNKEMIITKANKKAVGSSAAPSAFSIDKNKECEYIIYVAVPGMERKDFSVNIHNGQLVVSADKKEMLHCYDAGTGAVQARWEETFKLPKDADTVMTAAIYRNGELAIHIPKGKNIMPLPDTEVYVY